MKTSFAATYKNGKTLTYIIIFEKDIKKFVDIYNRVKRSLEIEFKDDTIKELVIEETV